MGCSSVQSQCSLVQDSNKGEVAGMSRYASGSFAFRDGFFPQVKALWRRALRNFWGVSHIVPLPHVMHKGEMSPIPVIVNVRKEPGFLMQSNEKKCGSHLSVILELTSSSPAAAANGNPKCRAGFRTTATDRTYSFLGPVFKQS